MNANNHKIGESAEKASLLIIVLIMMLSFAALIGSISFNASPSISPLEEKRPDTNDTLVCSWNSSADTVQQNVTWYKNGVSFLNESDVNSTSSLGSGNTSRGEVWNCTVIISNGTDTTIQSANVTIKNAQPSVPVLYNSSGQDIGNVTTAIEDQANNFTLLATDPDGDTLSYGYFLSLPPGASFNSGTGNFIWTPNQYVNNDTNITFYATDNFDSTPIGITAKKIFFSIQYVNDAPAFSPALANQVINEGQVFNYVISATDEESNLPYNFSMNVTPNISLVIVQLNSTSALIMLEGNRTTTYTEGGNYSINITVIDNESGSSTGSFNFSINQTNVAPVLEGITNKSSNQGQNLTFYVYADDSDVNNTNLAFNISTTSCTYSIANPWNITTVNSSHNATGLVNVSDLTNNHVICRYVRITVIDDNGAEDYQDVFLNISNTNDPPNVVVLSSYSNNTGGSNISSLSAYAESTFIYLVNATDIDNYTYEGEILTFGDNATFFDINATTGLVTFTPSQSDVGNHTINITATDDGGLSDYKLMNLEIINNSAPILSPIGNLSCAEGNECFTALAATDADGDNLTFTSNNSAVFNLIDNESQNPVWSAYANQTPNQSSVGNHSIFVEVTDARGASDNETFLFTINNTNDAPVLDSFTIPTPVVEGHSVSFYVFADDDDYDLPIGYAVTSYNGTSPAINLTEYLTFNSTNLTGASLFSISNYFNTSTNRTYGRVVFVPSTGSSGNYSVNFSVTDYAGASDYMVKNFTVIARTNPPNITNIMPYGRAFSNDTIFNFTNASNYNESLTSINFSENRSVVYNISVTDDTTAQNDLSYEWHVNGTLNSTSRYLNFTYGFFSSGKQNVTVIVYDDTYENSSWTWNVSVANVNRPPLFINPLSNLTINGTTAYTNYLKDESGVHFIDPDDDLNSNNIFDNGEVSSLTYESSSCSVANISVFDNSSIRVTPREIGVCYIYFTATDSGGLNEVSNTLRINVTDFDNETAQVEVEHPTSGGGGGRSTSIMVPITKKEEMPRALELIVPELVTIYENKTVVVPVTLQNTWNSTLRGIQLNASTNASEIKMSFTDDFFPEIPVGGEQHTTLMVTNYRMGENYNIKITANVSEPKTSDTATVMLNAIEQSQSGDEVNIKVTFAQDLMNANPECLELNELLSKAKDELALGNAATASYMVDGVINGCKYLVSISKKSEQKPSNILAKVIQKENSTYFIIFGIMATVLLLSVLLVKHKKSKAVKDKKQAEEKAKHEEEQSKPYWPGMQ